MQLLMAVISLAHFIGGIVAAFMANGPAVAWCIFVLVLSEWYDFVGMRKRPIPRPQPPQVTEEEL